MESFLTMEVIDKAADAVRARTSLVPKVGLILGSGLNALADSVVEPESIRYEEIPNFPASTVEGHVGRLVLGTLEGVPAIVMQGRVHYYEGPSLAQITLPVRVMKHLGVSTLIVTNAAGGVHPDFQPGDVMLITDHLNLMGMTGHNPLMGPNLGALGPRFPDMSQPYDQNLAELARQVSAAEGILLREGVYVWLSGPSFESPADLRFLRGAGADAVGMSTVPEVIVARHGAMRVLGLSGISNKANLDGSSVTTHDEVLAAGRIIAPKMEKIIRGVLRKL